MRKRNPELSLTRIIGILVFVAVAALVISRYKQFLSPGRLTGRSAAAAATALAQALELYEQGSFDAARETLAPVVSKSALGAEGPAALLLMARLERLAGDPAQALALLKRGYEEFPAHSAHPELAAAYGRALQEQGEADAAVSVLEEVRDTAPPDVRAPALVGLGLQAEAQGALLDARALYRQAFQDASPSSPGWNEALDHLGRVNVALIFGSAPTPESKVYTVQRGDSITSIGNALNTTQGLLTRANGLSETSTLSVSQFLKYTPKDFRIVIERATCRLFLTDKDGVFKRYPVGLGKPGHDTTLGSYKIGNKEKDPIWHKPGEGPIPAGDPRNELGTRWMPLIPIQEGLPTDLGIHGTIRPETIGLYSSNGCARLYPADIEELYDLVVRSTPVDIVEAFIGTESAPAAPTAVPTGQQG